MKKIFILSVLSLLIIGFGCQKIKPIDLSDGPNSVATTGTQYDQYLDREVPTSTVLEVGNGEVLQIFSPLAGQKVLSPLKITGLAPSSWFFEGSFLVKTSADNGVLLGKEIAKAQTEWTKPGLVPFATTVFFETPSDTKTGKIVLSADNPSGLSKYNRSVVLPISFFTPEDGKVVQIYFGNSQFNPDKTDCNEVYPVERLLTPKTQAVISESIPLLLNGLYENEKSVGYFSTINPGVNLLSAKIIDGVATVDFNEELEKGVAGSCNVVMIREQITRTLKQFSTVKDVIISVNGRTEGVLQP